MSKITAVKYFIENGHKTGKSFTFSLDPKDMTAHHTQTTVKKKVEDYILKGGIFKKEDLKDLKYQGLKEFMNEWRQIQETEKREIAAKQAQMETPLKE